MKLTFLVLLCGAYACSTNLYPDRPCGSNLNNLWLDVVAVVDSSQGMTADGLATVGGSIATIFGDSKIGASSTNPRTTRLGLVTYNYGVQRVADLKKYRSADEVTEGIMNDLTTLSNNQTSLIAKGLQEAQNLLFEQSFGTERDHYKKVVIVFASAYRGTGAEDPAPVANRLKTRGVKIITVAYDQGGEADIVEQLSKIASTGFAFNKDGVVKKVQNALLQVNCFCPSNHWTQYRTGTEEAKKFYGTCIQPVGMSATWRVARLSCSRRWNNTYLASEFSQEKHDFIFNTVQSSNVISPPYKYHIGLNRESGMWQWEQPKESVLVRGWFNWGQGYPIGGSGLSAGANVENEHGFAEWRNFGPTDSKAADSYVCETPACDTDNYCDKNVNDH